jgi:hypothetical protein
MARYLVRHLCFAAIAAAPALYACSKSSPDNSDRVVHPAAAPTAAVDRSASPSTAHGASKTSERVLLASARTEQYQTDDPPPWLAELLHAPDPNVRIQALDAWAQHPGESLDPVTYALVDPDESVRARAQEVLEQELVRR